MPSITGKDLNILICCDYVRHHNWMTFSSWYSIFKNLPDAKVKIICKRTDIKETLFNWTRKCNVPFMQYSADDRLFTEVARDLGIFEPNEEFMEILPNVMAVSHYNEFSLGPVDCQSDNNSTFVRYLKCGKFVDYEWINTNKNPFGNTKKLFSDDLMLNEYRILKMWDKCHNTYTAIA